LKEKDVIACITKARNHNTLNNPEQLIGPKQQHVIILELVSAFACDVVMF